MQNSKSQVEILLISCLLALTMVLCGCQSENNCDCEPNATDPRSESDPPTTVISSGDWACAAEARNMPLDRQTLDLIYTALAQDNTVYDVVDSGRYVKYVTEFKDEVYFELPVETRTARIFTRSRIPANNVGIIRRLDNNLYKAAQFLAQSIIGNEDAIFNLFVGLPGKYYYTRTPGAYSRAYLADAPSPIGSLSGTFTIPFGSKAFLIRLGRYQDAGWGPSGNMKEVTVTLDIPVIKFNKTLISKWDPKGNIELLFNGSPISGSYIYNMNFAYSYGYPSARRAYVFEVAGDSLGGPVTVDQGTISNPSIVSLGIKELAAP